MEPGSIGPGASAEARLLLEEAARTRACDTLVTRRLAAAARVKARVAGDRATEAAALHLLAGVAWADDRPEEALSLLVEGGDLASRAGATDVESRVEHLLGQVHLRSANLAEAFDHCQRALERREAGADDLDTGEILVTLAGVHRAMADPDRAVERLEQALAVFELCGRPDRAASTLGEIARIHASRSDCLAAVAVGRRAVELAREHRLPGLSRLLTDLAEAAAGIADLPAAVACFAEARQVLARLAEHGETPPTQLQLGIVLAEGRVALRRGALPEAIAVLQVALDTAERTGSEPEALEIDDLLATAFKRSGRFEEALERRESYEARYRRLADEASERRLRVLQAAHGAAAARHESEVVRLREAAARPADQPPVSSASSVSSDPVVAATQHLEAFHQLAVLTEYRDPETDEHTERVGDLAAEIAHALGQPLEWCEQLRLAARLHDIGKVVVPDSILRKAGPLTVEEYETMKAHTSMGHRILAGHSAPLFQMAAEIAQAHHEWWDGTGYPLGLSGPSIALSGRIVAVADVYDALLSLRPYKRAWGHVESARFVLSGRGVQFDPEVVDAFVAVLRSRHPETASELGRA